MAMNVGGAKGRAEINVTPMIDVLLVLLIIFMVVVNSDAVGLDAKVPEKPKDSVPGNPQDIVILVHGDATVTLNQEVIQDADLETRPAPGIPHTREPSRISRGGAGTRFPAGGSGHRCCKGVGLDRIAMLPKDQPSNL